MLSLSLPGSDGPIPPRATRAPVGMPPAAWRQYIYTNDAALYLILVTRGGRGGA